jgi:hypothetical protein
MTFAGIPCRISNAIRTRVITGIMIVRQTTVAGPDNPEGLPDGLVLVDRVVVLVSREVLVRARVPVVRVSRRGLLITRHGVG